MVMGYKLGVSFPDFFFGRSRLNLGLGVLVVDGSSKEKREKKTERWIRKKLLGQTIKLSFLPI